ncbi:MAG TPA: hypothetical protein VFW38_00445 [Solirubrobacteraceae bacterium]|nr:hypothetical protein [Solirubrobacteraceae bacterium]
MLRKLTLPVTLLALIALTSTAQAASIWTPLTSGTSGTISSIVYQSPTRFWYATTNGQIAFWNGSGFTQGIGIPTGEQFTGLAFQPAGSVGYAVAGNGDVWQTTNAGVSWTKLATQRTATSCLDATATNVTELNAVAFASASTAYLLGDDNTLLESTNAGSATPTFTEINKVGGACRAQSDNTSQNLTDATFLPANPLAGIMVTQDFGTLYGSSNGFTSGAQINGDTVNQFQGRPRIAQDAADPNRVFVADHSPGGSGCGTLCLVVSDDGGHTTAAAKLVNDTSPIVGLYGISAQSGTAVTAGTGGEIFTSVDGTNFYNQPAEGTLATENWRAEAAFDAAHAAVGGENGGLAITAAANTIPQPVVAPGTTPNVPAGNAPLAPPSGSRAVKFSAGGATITIYRVVTITGRNARFVPLIVSATKPRKFTVKILPLKGKKALAVGRLTLKGRHGGHGTIHVKLPAKVKPGSYYILVRETTLQGKKVGKLLKVRFTLK